MELSTTIPMAKLSPARLTTLILRPISVMIRKVAMMLMGIATEMMIVLAKFLKKIISTVNAKMAARTMFFLTRSMALSIYLVSS